MRGARHVARMGQMRKSYNMVGKPETKRPLGRLRCRWRDDITMDLKGNRVWTYILIFSVNLAQVTNQWRILVNTVMNLRIP